VEPARCAAQQEIAADSDRAGVRFDAEFVVQPPQGLVPFVAAAGGRILLPPAPQQKFQGVGPPRVRIELE
jgi:hypothetical protein